MDKLRLDCLLFSCAMKDYWLIEFQKCIKDRSLLFGPRWYSTNRRYELARYCYEYWYDNCTEEERAEFHRIRSLKLSRNYF